MLGGDYVREALFDAMLRREVYASTGPRITLRFFGGWHFATEDADKAELVAIGYATGVPMGGDLPARLNSPRPGAIRISMPPSARFTMCASLKFHRYDGPPTILNVSASRYPMRPR